MKLYMEKKEVYDDIISIIIELMGEDFIPIKNIDLHSQGIDSISFIELIIKLEDYFNIKFSDDFILSYSELTIDRIYNYIVEIDNE